VNIDRKYLIACASVFVVILLAVLSFLFLKHFTSKQPAKAQTQEVPTFTPHKVKRSSERGIYITSWSAQSKRKMDYIKNIMKTRGLNTIVVDVNYLLDPYLIPLAKQHKLSRDIKVTAAPALSRLTEDFHKEGFIVTARIVCFKDDHLVIARPDLSVMLPGGVPYRDHKGGHWADPYSEEVRIYKELMAEMAALSGVDEVQFDYIRFPAEGKAKNAIFPFEIKDISRVDVICQFLKDVRTRLDKYNVSMALDIFGVVAWQSKTDIKTLGQDLKRMAKYLDVLSPMLYPSHFHAGYDGFANPGSEPYYFMNTGVKKSLEIISGETTVLAPWIQGFNMSSPNYGPSYITAQIKACRDAGVHRFLIWNARNVYDTVPVRVGN